MWKTILNYYQIPSWSVLLEINVIICPDKPTSGWWCHCWWLSANFCKFTCSEVFYKLWELTSYYHYMYGLILHFCKAPNYLLWQSLFCQIQQIFSLPHHLLHQASITKVFIKILGLKRNLKDWQIHCNVGLIVRTVICDYISYIRFQTDKYWRIPWPKVLANLKKSDILFLISISWLARRKLKRKRYFWKERSFGPMP